MKKKSIVNKTQHLCMKCGWIDSDKWLDGEHNMHNYEWSLK